MFESITRVLRTELRIAAETGASSFSIDQTSLIGRFPGLAQPAHSAPVAETSLNSDAAAGRLHVAFALRRRQSRGEAARSKNGEKGDEEVYSGRSARNGTVATRPRPDDPRLDPGGVSGRLVLAGEH